MTTFGDLIAETFSAHPRFNDFERVRDLRWVRPSGEHLQEMVEFTPLKGLSFTAQWGWSVDFVPLFRGSRMSWKRSTDKAELDLCIAPIDLSGTVPAQYSFTITSPEKHVARVGRTSLDAALADWQKVGSRADLIPIFEQRSVMQFRRFALQNYVQSYLAWGLVLLSLGRRQDGEQYLASFCDLHGVDPTLTMLRKAVAEAEAMAA